MSLTLSDLMYKKIKETLTQRRIHTFFSFGVIQAAQILLPFIALPYLSLKLGANTFGILLYMMNFSAIIWIVVDWGFTLGGVREVAKANDDSSKYQNILSHIFLGKIILATGCAVVAACTMPFLSHAPEDPAMYWLAVGYGVTLGFNPTWFFQGKGTGMLRMAIIDVSSSALALALTFLFVMTESDAFLYLAFLLLCKGAAYAFQILWLFRTHGRPTGSVQNAFSALKTHKTIFFSRIASMSYMQASVVIMGQMVPPDQLGFFVVANKVARGVGSLGSPLMQTLFPEMCAVTQGNKQTSDSLLTYSLLITACCMIILTAFTLVIAPSIMQALTNVQSTEATFLLRVQAFFIPFLACNMILGTQGLVARGLERTLTIILSVVGISSLPLAFFVTLYLGVSGAAMISVLVESSIFCALGMYLIRYTAYSFTLGSIKK